MTSQTEPSGDYSVPPLSAAPVVFFDKDGTLVEDVPYNVDPARMRLAPGAGPAAAALHTAGWRVAVVTNQSGVARGFFPEVALIGIEARLRELLAEFAVPLAGFFYCPHHPDGIIREYAFVCDCRKPAPGLILAAAQHLGVEPSDCWVVGNEMSDVEAARRAGCRTVLLAPSGLVALSGTMALVDTAPDLLHAAAVILGTTQGTESLNGRVDLSFEHPTSADSRSDCW